MKKLVFLLLVMNYHVHANGFVKSTALANANLLMGSFGTEPSYGHPSQASYAHISNEKLPISVKFYPIDTCQTVRICIIEKPKNNNPMNMAESWCDNSILYHPPTGKIEIFASDGPQKPSKLKHSGYTTSLDFKPTDALYELRAAKEPFYAERLIKKEEHPYFVALNEKMLYVMTNSRQCQPQVLFNGRVVNEGIFTRDAFLGDYPKVFEFLEANQKVETYYTHTGHADGTYKRLSDMLPSLKTLTKTSDTLKQLKFACWILGGGLSNRERIVKPSVLMVKKLANNNQAATKWEFGIGMLNCHWIRLWFTESSSWSDYASKINNELHQTIDLFFHEGFALFPDREKSIELPGSSMQIQSIKIVHHGNGIAEIWFGRIGKEYINPISFHMMFLEKRDFNVFMIRSPLCDARFGLGRSAHKEAHNLVELRACKAYSINQN